MRTTISDLSDGYKVKTIWLNGAQYCSVIPKGEKDEVIKVDTSIQKAGPSSTITYKELRQQVLDGHVVYTKNGKSIPCTQRADKTPDKKVKVRVTEEKGKRIYQLL